jgi:hypothetical protein
MKDERREQKAEKAEKAESVRLSHDVTSTGKNDKQE